MRTYEKIIMDLISNGVPFEFYPIGSKVKGSRIQFEFCFKFINGELGVCYRENSEKEWSILSWDRYEKLMEKEYNNWQDRVWKDLSYKEDC